jgi:hypothetical protein
MERSPIGMAADFYRIRLRRLDAPVEADLEWRDDILYREPPQGGSGPALVYVVEAVDVDDLETSHPIGSFSAYEEALALQAKVVEDIGEQTRSQFEKTWFSEP